MLQAEARKMYDAFLSAYDNFVESETYQIDIQDFNFFKPDGTLTCHGFTVGDLPKFVIYEERGNILNFCYMSIVKAGELTGIQSYWKMVKINKRTTEMFKYENTYEEISKFLNEIKDFKAGIGKELITACCQRLINIDMYSDEKITSLDKHIKECWFFSKYNSIFWAKTEVNFLLRRMFEQSSLIFYFRTVPKSRNTYLFPTIYSHNFISDMETSISRMPGITSRPITPDNLYEYSVKRTPEEK